MTGIREVDSQIAKIISENIIAGIDDNNMLIATVCTNETRGIKMRLIVEPIPFTDTATAMDYFYRAEALYEELYPDYNDPQTLINHLGNMYISGDLFDAYYRVGRLRAMADMYIENWLPFHISSVYAREVDEQGNWID